MKTFPDKVDVVVAGAGPSGCALAAKVAASGHDVLLLERSAVPGGGRDWIVDVEKTAFERSRVPEPESGALWEVADRSLMLSPDGVHEIELRPAPVVAIRNGEYVRQLWRWARDRGVDARTGCEVLGPVMNGEKVTGVRFKNPEGATKTVSAPLVADCSGIAGSIRRKTPARWGLDEKVDAFDIVLARREVRKIDAGVAVGRLESLGLKSGVRIDRPGILGPYSTESYHLDTGKEYLDILVGSKLDPRLETPEEWINERYQRWEFVGRMIFGGGGPIPIRRTMDSMVGDGLLLLGDCACQVIPAHGSGTASALIAAELASCSIERALADKRYDRSALWGYSHSFQAGRGALLAYFQVMRLQMEKLTVSDIDEMIRRGLLSADEVYSGMVPERFKPSPRALLNKLVRSLSSPGILASFARAGLTAEKAFKHYWRYPDEFDAKRIESWVGGIPFRR